MFVVTSRIRFADHSLIHVTVFTTLLDIFDFVHVPINPMPVALRALTIVLTNLVLKPIGKVLSILLVLMLAFINVPLLNNGNNPTVFINMDTKCLCN